MIFTIRVVPLIFVVATLAAAEDARPIRICVGPLENHSSYQLPIEKLKKDFVSQLSHKNINAINITGQDLDAEVASNSCEYLVGGVFSDFARLKPGESVVIGGIIVDDRKRFAL